MVEECELAINRRLSEWEFFTLQAPVIAVALIRVNTGLNLSTNSLSENHNWN